MPIIRRLFEILPALLAWSTLILPLIFLGNHPEAVTAFILLYVFLWFLRAIEYSYFLISSYRKYIAAQQVDWQEELKTLDTDISADEIIHLIIVPTYKEPLQVLEESISSIADSRFDLKRIYFCLATEARDATNGQQNARDLQKRFGNTFGKFLHIEHPDGLPDEIRGKGANISFAAARIAEQLAEEGIDERRVLVTTLDADNRLHPDLLSALTHAYCLTPKRHRRAFQPIPLFFNNIWEVPTINRMVALASGFWHLIEAGRPDRLRNFSSHSQPLSALIEMDFWDKTTIVEDGRQYWRSYLHFNGDYEVVPVFLPVFQDAATSDNLPRSLASQFNQLRRWAWGSADIAYFTEGIIKKRRHLPGLKTAFQYYRLVEGHYMWSTAAIFLAIATPATRLLNQEFSYTVFGSHFSVILSVIFKVAVIGIVISMVLSFLVIPHPPQKIRRFSIFWQWLLLPITTIGFGSLPALITQTQLALGKRMDFNVTLKIRNTLDKNGKNPQNS